MSRIQQIVKSNRKTKASVSVSENKSVESIKSKAKVPFNSKSEISVSNNKGVKNIALNLKVPRNTKIKVKKS